MKKTKMMAVCAILSGSLLFSSCIGSFGLWNNLKSWNQGIGNKFVNEIVFLAFHIVPVYEVAYLADILVLNSIEFWSGSNPVAEVGTIKTVKGENGEYLVRTNENGYTITKKEKKVRLLTGIQRRKPHMECRSRRRKLRTDYHERRRNNHAETAGRHPDDRYSGHAGTCNSPRS